MTEKHTKWTIFYVDEEGDVFCENLEGPTFRDALISYAYVRDGNALVGLPEDDDDEALLAKLLEHDQITGALVVPWHVGQDARRPVKMLQPDEPVQPS